MHLKGLAMHRQRLLPIALFVLFASQNLAHADAVDDLVKSVMERQKIPGLAVAVVRDGQVVKIQGYGLANVENAVPVKPDTMFQLASVTKQFVATSLLMLVEEGKLSLDDKVSKYLPEAPESWKDITVRHLLNHTSGLGNDDSFGYGALKKLEEVLASVAKMKLANPTGQKYLYSNIGYNMAGLILERVSGKRWDEFLQERILKPVGMTATRRYSQSAIIPHRASGYVLDAGAVRNAPSLQRDLPSGGLITNAQDLAKWAIAVLSKQPLKEAGFKELWAPAHLKDGSEVSNNGSGYGLGWQLNRYRGRNVMEHGGARPGFATYLGLYPDDHMGVILLCNLGGARLPALARQIVNVYSAPEGDKAK